MDGGRLARLGCGKRLRAHSYRIYTAPGREHILMGTVQGAIANGVLDSVRTGDLPKYKVSEFGVIVSVWLNPSVADDKNFNISPARQRICSYNLVARHAFEASVLVIRSHFLSLV